MGLRIKRIATHFPATTLTNEDISAEFSIPPSQVFKKTGIHTRFISAADETASDLAFEAAQKLFNEEPGIREQIDFLVFCSVCFDYAAPASSCILQHRLGLSQQTGCMDLPYGCSGYVYGLGIANGLLHSGMAKTILFLTADTSTRYLEHDNIEQRSLFSDAATATLLTADGSGPGAFVFGTDGSGALDLYIDRSAFRNPPDAGFINETGLRNGRMVMNGINVFSFAVKTVPPLVKQTLEKSNLGMEDIDLFVFHQANGFMLETLRKKMNIPTNKFFCNIDKVGNTVSSSIPLALQEAADAGALKRGMKVLLAGFGVGNSWAATVINF